MTTKYANLITSNHDIKTNPYIAGWSSPVARQAHNLKVVGSNPTPATKLTPVTQCVAGFLILGPIICRSRGSTVEARGRVVLRGRGADVCFLKDDEG